MSSDSPPLTLESIERFLAANGLDPARAPAVRAALEPPAPTAPRSAVELGLTANLRPARAPAEHASDRVPVQQATIAMRSGAPSLAADATLLSGGVGPSPSAALPPIERPDRRLFPGVLLGSGGMGEVFRVRDEALHRDLAMKVLNEALTALPDVRAFMQEAEVTAQLAHPGIPPVHEIGELPGGRPYFTMKEVHGITLAQVIDERATPSGAEWSEQRLLATFHKVCEAVAYGHSRGVAHCDLKPHNVMVGAFGEVLVMDWGAARLVPRSGATLTDEPPVTIRERSMTEGLVAGTPSYMAPEHAAAALDQIGTPTDVFALGVMLFELLAGERPYKGTRAELAAAAAAGVVPPLPRRPGSSIDDALYAIIVRAMRPEPRERYPDATAMADELARWREGAVRREKARALVRAAERLLADGGGPETDRPDGIDGVDRALARADALQLQASTELAQLGPDATAAAKAAAWATQDDADAIASAAILRLLEAEQHLQHALAQAPELAEAKALIARLRFVRCVDAIQRRAWDDAARHELVLRANDVGEFADWLAGMAPLGVATEPQSRVKLYRYEVRARCLVAEYVRDLGTTPLVDLELPVGSYLLMLAAPDRPAIRYPVMLRRRGGWSDTRPGEARPVPLELPPAGELGPGELWVAPGCCELGGDASAPGAIRAARAWVDGFVIREHPITFAELATFLAEPAGAAFSRGVLRDGLQVWHPDWPAVGVSWDAARAYAAWWAARTGQPWRLPSEAEWEKAARGVDGRFFPWGDFTDAALCHCRTVERAPRAPAPISAYPTDCSPYGVRGMGGNVREWCHDAASLAGPTIEAGVVRPPADAPEAVERIVRGGSFRQAPEAARVAARSGLAADRGYPDVGFRLVRSR